MRSKLGVASDRLLPEHRRHPVQAAVATSDNHEGGPSWKRRFHSRPRADHASGSAMAGREFGRSCHDVPLFSLISLISHCTHEVKAVRHGRKAMVSIR